MIVGAKIPARRRRHFRSGLLPLNLVAAEDPINIRFVQWYFWRIVAHGRLTRALALIPPLYGVRVT
jgi:hypothetical protein